MISRRFASRRAAFHLGMQAIKFGFGGVANIGFAVIVIFSIMAIGWFGDYLSSLIAVEYKPLVLVPLLLLLLAFSIFSRMQLKPVAPSIEQCKIQPCKALIWFLSPPGYNKNNKKACSGDEELPDDMGSWRMAYEAINQHQKKSKLQAIIIIPSSDTDDKNDGTCHHVDRFIASMSKATSVSADCFVGLEGYTSGVDFEDAEALYKAVEAAYDLLNKENINETDAVLDITGGMKLPATIGGIAGLGEGRRFQYVSTRTYHIHEYNITYKVVS